jgi:hypothetical protein
MGESATKRLPQVNFPSAVERAVGGGQLRHQRDPDVALVREDIRWFGQPLSRVTPTADRKAHPQTTPPEVVVKVIEAALSNPIWGCCKLAEDLKHQNILISSPTVQKILIRERIGSRRERATRVLELAERGHELTLQQSLQIKRIMR